MSFSNIVVATDFTDCGTAALERACEMAHEGGARLHVIYILPKHLKHTWALRSSDETLTADVAHEADLARSVIVAAMAQHDLNDATVRVCGGDAAAQIVAYAQEHHADLVVCGTHGRHGIDRVFLGSVAEHVLRDAACAVITVKASPEFLCA